MALRFTSLLLLAGMALSPWIVAAETDAEAWFNGRSASEVNDGELVFLERLPEKPVHHHHNHITMTDSSLIDGWVQLAQCHRNLDAVPRSQVIFRPEHTRDLRVVGHLNIGEVWVEGPSVQLKDVGRGAELCLALESRALIQDGDGIYSLHNGPFMRRFLDGYYPMRVSMTVDYSAALALIDVTPAAQSGLDVVHRPGGVDLDARFEGRLNTIIRFRTNPTPDHAPTEPVP
jgi:hypothetical protein